jgi:cobalt-precorrin-6B (C15)-methyltransferase
MVEWLGIPDEEFYGHGDFPITKQEVRAVTIAKARIGNTDVIYDIGAGVGSITVEAAMIAREGRVLAIEKEAERVALLRKNVEKFGIHNVDVVEGEAPKVLSDLPLADRIIIGGTGGKMNAIIKKCVDRLRHDGRMVINVVTLESLIAAVRILEIMELEFEVTQIFVSRGVKVGDRRVMRGLNPVYIIDVRI